MVSVLFRVRLLHNCLRLLVIEVRLNTREDTLEVFLSRYIELKSQDPLDKDHRGVKLKKQGSESQPRQRTQCVYKEE